MLLLLLLTLPAVVQAQFTYTTDNGTITITRYTGYGEVAAIPSTINGLPVTSRGDGAFYNCSGLTNVTIPYSVTSIGRGAFSGCASLAAITVDPLNVVFSSVAGVLFNQNQTALLQCPGARAGNYTVPNSVTSIGDSLLTKASSLDVIRIVASIGGTEVQHFEVWQDKAGNAPPVPATGPNAGALFPQFPIALDQTANGVDPADPIDTNQIMPHPCTYISKHLPLCSVIRPTATANAGGLAAFKGFTAMGLFQGQSEEFFAFVFELAEEADEASRGF